MPSADTQRLLDRFRDYCRDRDLSAERAASLVRLSKATVQQLMGGSVGNPRSVTIERVRAFMNRIAAPELSDADIFRLVAARMNLSAEQVARTLEIYAGSYLAYRLTPTNRSIIVSKVVIRALSRDDPLPFFFEDVEICDDLELSETTRHHFLHSGPVLYREGRLYFLSIASGNVREMIFTAPLSREFSALRGLILTVSAAREPYATRVLLRRQIESGAALTGSFALDDPTVADMVHYVSNARTVEFEPLKVK